MKLSDYLETEGITAAELSRRLGISKAAISKWDEIPEKWLGVLSEIKRQEIMEKEGRVILQDNGGSMPKYVSVDLADGKDEAIIYGKTEHGIAWFISGDKITWLGSEFGHGSEWDYNYSAAKIFHIRRLLEQVGSVQGVFEFCNCIFEKDLIRDVSKNVVCPNIPGFEGF